MGVPRTMLDRHEIAGGLTFIVKFMAKVWDMWKIQDEMPVTMAVHHSFVMLKLKRQFFARPAFQYSYFKLRKGYFRLLCLSSWLSGYSKCNPGVDLFRLVDVDNVANWHIAVSIQEPHRLMQEAKSKEDMAT